MARGLVGEDDEVVLWKEFTDNTETVFMLQGHVIKVPVSLFRNTNVKILNELVSLSEFFFLLLFLLISFICDDEIWVPIPMGLLTYALSVLE